MKLYKLTDQNKETMNHTVWGEGIEHTATGRGPLCSPGWLHAYTDPLLAVLLSPIHTRIENPRLWECEGDVGMDDNGLKVGCTRLKTIREIELPVVTTEQRVKFGILCALEMNRNEEFEAWARGWLDGTDRTEAAARAAAWAATRAAAWAAESAALTAARAAAWAAEVATRAAESAAWAAEAATRAAEELNLIGIAHRAVE